MSCKCMKSSSVTSPSAQEEKDKDTLRGKSGNPRSGKNESDSEAPIETITLNDGSVYTGTLKNGVMHGRGRLELKNGQVYEGQFANGKKEGQGEWHDKQGNSYDGEWKADKKHGKGVYRTSDGLTFEGSFLNNMKHGKATITTPDQTRYICNFVNDEESGEAEFFFSNGDHAFGYIKDGNLHNHGRYEFKNGDIYVGEFNLGLFHGKGYYKWNDSTSYKIYEGHYVNGIKEGPGTLKNMDGRILVGNFVGNQLDGEVIEISSQGNKTKVLYNNGKYIKAVDRIENDLKVTDYIDEREIETTIFSDPDHYKKFYEFERKKRAKVKLQVKPRDANKNKNALTSPRQP